MWSIAYELQVINRYRIMDINIDLQKQLLKKN